MKKVIAVFEIGEMTKRFFLFDHELNIVHHSYTIIPAITDENNIECEDIESVESWIKSTIREALKDEKYHLIAINYATGETSLAFLNENGDLLAPIYFHSWPMCQDLIHKLYDEYGGKDEFCRKTGSPSTGMLNSGLQILWLKKEYKNLFDCMAYVLHYPQYLAHIFTHSIVSECTSIGCHTAMWDFDNLKYHQWLMDEKIVLTNPMCNDYVIEIQIDNHPILSGIGVHDRSASLVPFLRKSCEKFLFVSTGKRCVNMAPYNRKSLTSEQVNNECFYLYGDNKKPFQASRWAMGEIYQENLKRLAEHFNTTPDSINHIKTNHDLIISYLKEGKNRVFFKNGVHDTIIDTSVVPEIFTNFIEAYHRLIYDLTLAEVESLQQIIYPDNKESRIILSGDFASNEIFARLMANFFPDHKIFTSLVQYPSAMGAALVIWRNMDETKRPPINIDLKEREAFPYL